MPARAGQQGNGYENRPQPEAFPAAGNGMGNSYAIARRQRLAAGWGMWYDRGGVDDFGVREARKCVRKTS